MLKITESQVKIQLLWLRIVHCLHTELYIIINSTFLFIDVDSHLVIFL